MKATVIAPPLLNRPRTDARKSKLRSLTPEQSAALVSWLFDDKVTYQSAIQRLQEKFGVKLALRQMHEFWDSHARPAAQELPHDSGILFDVVIQPSRPVRVVVKQSPFKIEITPA